MFFFERWTANFPEPYRQQFDEFIARLPGHLRPLFHASREAQASILGLEVKLAKRADPRRGFESNNVVRGEVITDGRNLFILQLREFLEPSLVNRGGERKLVGRKVTSRLMVQIASGERPSTSSLEFRQYVCAQLGCDLVQRIDRSERFEELLSEGRTTAEMPQSDEMEKARVLADGTVRAAAIAIKASLGGLLVSDLARQLAEKDSDPVDEVRKQLIESGLIESEFVVTCSKTKSQIARFPSHDAIKIAGQAGAKCACGKRLDDESIEEAVTLTQAAVALLDHSQWFVFILLDELLKLGIPLDRILLEQQLGGDELDCLADVSGELALFELKDKQFNLGNAYSFGAKMSLVRPQHPVVVTTATVGGDAKEHFQRAEEAQRRGRRSSLYTDDDAVQGEVLYVEGLSELRRQLTRLLVDIHRRYAISALGEVRRFAMPDSEWILRAVNPDSEDEVC